MEGQRDRGMEGEMTMMSIPLFKSKYSLPQSCGIQKRRLDVQYEQNMHSVPECAHLMWV